MHDDEALLSEITNLMEQHYTKLSTERRLAAMLVITERMFRGFINSIMRMTSSASTYEDRLVTILAIHIKGLRNAFGECTQKAMLESLRMSDPEPRAFNQNQLDYANKILNEVMEDYKKKHK